MALSFLFSHPDFEKEMLEECALFSARPERIANGLFAIETSNLVKHKTSLVWPRDVWAETGVIEIESISKAVAALREHSKQPWLQVTTASHRRGELIEAEFNSKSKLATRRAPKVGWPSGAAKREPHPAVFTLLSPTKMAFCLKPAEEVPGGEWVFGEDRNGPPSRAYLKLWEWGWRTKVRPIAGQVALDLGACPGGWTWVLAKAGLKVHAFDRSPLAASLREDLSKSDFARIEFAKADAFQVTPDRAPRTDWVFCDVIAEPRRTVELIEAWIPTKAGLVFTIKFKGATDFDSIARLQRIPGAHVRHLNVNKHEVTFWRETVSN